MIIDESEHEKSLLHYGILRRSGRYPWGSGGTVPTRSKSFLNYVDELREQGLKDSEIARGMGLSLNDLRAMRSIATNSVKAYNISLAERLRGRGWSVPAIATRMGVPKSTVRSWLEPGTNIRKNSIDATMEALKNAVGDDGIIDIGKGVELEMNVSRTLLDTAVAGLKMQGYQVYPLKHPQVAGGGQMTTTLAICPPGMKFGEAIKRISDIRTPSSRSTDYGETWIPLLAEPLSLSSSRVMVRHAEEGGANADGTIYVRPGVKDLSMGGNHYAQVRILVDGTHYLKGMAVYRSDLPKGVDVVFNTNKKRSETGGDKLKAMKPIETLTENPFGTLIKRQIREVNPDGTEGRTTSVMNIVNESGDWNKWSKNLSAQMLSKQSIELAKRQLEMSYEVKKAEYDEIMSLTNPTVRKKLLDDFAEGADASAVHLKAHALPGQQWKVILPIEDMPETQVFAPSFKHGERVVLIRYPHGGKFEIPELVVNNRHRTAVETLGTDLRAAIGIHPNVAAHLSGADFDGDTVLVIPNKSGVIKTLPAVKELQEFNPRLAFKLPEGKPRYDKSYMEKQMGFVSNLISDMTVMGAPLEDIVRAVKHSMVVIDAHKHGLDFGLSKQVHGIPDLMLKYQGNRGGGASTIVSRSGTNAKKTIPKRREARKEEGGPIDPVTGERVYTPTGESYVNKEGKTVVKTEKQPRLALVRDAHDLSSGTDIETVYADHSNRMKHLANQARLSMLKTPNLERSPSAAKVYAPEVESLDAKLTLALQNRPLERQAQRLADTMVKAKKAANPDLDDKQIKKLESVALETARKRLNSAKPRIEPTDREWEAIQAGAISNNKLTEILDNANMDRIRALATPRATVKMTDARTAQARNLLELGYTFSEVAERLNVSVTTIERSVYGDQESED